MAIGSGLSGSFGWSKETTWGTRVAPAKFIRHRRAEFQPVYNRVQGEGIQTGAYGLRGDQMVQTHQAATASVEFDVTTLNMVQLWENLMGSTTSSTQLGGTAAYSHVFHLADNYGKGMTLQQGVALRGGTVKCKEITGAKMQSATFSCGIGEILTCQAEFDGEAYDTSQSLAAVSYVSGLPFHFGGGTTSTTTVKLGTYASETAVSGVRAFSATINRPMDTEAFYFGMAGIKSEPVMNAPVEITGTIEADYLATADFEDRFTGMTLPSLEIQVSGDIIASTYRTSWILTVPGVHFEGPGQNNDGYAEPKNAWNWTWKYDGTNLPKITQVSTETSV